MSFENIRFSKSNLAVYGGYFWMLDDLLDMLIVKTDDGTQAFTYPLDTALLDGAVTCIQYDGYNLWSLETIDDVSVRIRRWYIHNYIVKLADSYDLVGTSSHSYNSKTIAIETYEIYFSGDEASYEQQLNVKDLSDGDIIDKLAGGNTVVLGPNEDGKFEEFSVSSVGSDYVVINGHTDYAYANNNSIRFYKNIWLFNNYNGIDNSTGALYRIDPYTGSTLQKYPDNIYKNIVASTFFGVPYFVFNTIDPDTIPPTEDPKDYAIAYVKGTNMIFLNPDDLSTAYGSLIMDNLHSNMASVIGIYDISIYNKNLYRLQGAATYYGVTSEFDDGTYNYQLSTLNSLITSISLNADPAILPANGTSTTAVTAIVKDQFNQPVPAKAVAFTCDDPDGEMLSIYVNTNTAGEAITAYQAGIEAREVRITATAQQ